MTELIVSDLTVEYGSGGYVVRPLNHLSFTASDGELVVLLGPSGCGKTTLLSCLAGLLTPTSGTITLDGEDVGRLTGRALAAYRRHAVGVVFQNFNLLPRTSALDQVMMPLTYAYPRVSESAGAERAKALLHLVGLEERMDHHPSQLSGGQQQRVAIARALINNPPILLADEPTGNLDSKTTVEILDTIRRLNAEEGITVIIVTHDPGVAKTAKRTIHMRDGLIEDATFAPAA